MSVWVFQGLGFGVWGSNLTGLVEGVGFEA